LLLFGYAAGAAASLAVALLGGGRVFRALKRGLGPASGSDAGFGVAVFDCRGAIALDWIARVDSIVGSQHESDRTILVGAIRSPVPAQPVIRNGEQIGARGLPVEGALPRSTAHNPGSTHAAHAKRACGQSRADRLLDLFVHQCLRSLLTSAVGTRSTRTTVSCDWRSRAPSLLSKRTSITCVRPCMTGRHLPCRAGQQTMRSGGVDNQTGRPHLFIDVQGRIRGHSFSRASIRSPSRRCAPCGRGRFQGPAPAGVSMIRLRSSGSPDDSNMLSPETYVGYARASTSARLRRPADHARTYAAPTSGAESMGTHRFMDGW